MGDHAMHADPVSSAVFETARERVERYLRRERDAGRTRVTLAELTEATALDPETAAAVMADLERGTGDALAVRRSRGSERAWSIRTDG